MLSYQNIYLRAKPTLGSARNRLFSNRFSTHKNSTKIIASGNHTKTSPSTTSPIKPSQHPIIAVDPNNSAVSSLHRTSQPLPWVSIFIVLGLTVSSVASMITAFILYMRPVFIAAQRAAETTEKAALDMEKTSIMFREDIPLTMKDIQKASEEFELLGKQLNFFISKPLGTLSPRPNVTSQLNKESDTDTSASSTGGSPSTNTYVSPSWVGQAGSTTINLSRRVAADTSNLATSLWSTMNQLRSQLGWAGMSSETAAEAKRLVYIGRQQQEARSWIASWRSRTGGKSATARTTSNVVRLGSQARAIAAGQRRQDESDLRTVQEMGRLLQLKVGSINQQQQEQGQQREEEDGLYDDESQPEEAREAVEAVLAALERAQRAAEEAAASSSALERAIEKAENAGALSSDEEDDGPDGYQQVGLTAEGKENARKD